MGIRKPSAILEASGAFGKNPNRRRPHEPRSNQPVGDPPAYLSPTEREIWAAIVFDCPAGVLTAADRWVLAMACQLQALAQARTIKGVERQQLISCLARFGMTPSDRARVSVAPSASEQDDPFSEFA